MYTTGTVPTGTFVLNILRQFIQKVQYLLLYDGMDLNSLTVRILLLCSVDLNSLRVRILIL